MALPPKCTPHPFKHGKDEYCQYKALPCDGSGDDKKKEAAKKRPDEANVEGSGRCGAPESPENLCLWNGRNCYRWGGPANPGWQQLFAREPCQGAATEDFLRNCEKISRNGYRTPDCPVKEPPATVFGRAPVPLHVQGDPWCTSTGANTLRCYKFGDTGCYQEDRLRGTVANILGWNRKIATITVHTERLSDLACPCDLKEQYYRTHNQLFGTTIDPATCPKPDPKAAKKAAVPVEIVVMRLADGSCVAGPRNDRPTGATILSTAEVLLHCQHEASASPRTAAPSVRTQTPRVSAAPPSCSAWHAAAQVDEVANYDQRQARGTCSVRNLSAEQCTAIGGTHFKPDHGSGFTECFRFASAGRTPAVPTPTPSTVTTPKMPTPTPPKATSPTVPSPQVTTPAPATPQPSMSAPCQQLVSNYVAAAQAKDGPHALAGYTALKRAGGCGVLKGVDRPQPRVAAPQVNDPRFVARGATPNSDAVVGACDASPAECAARVRQLQAGTSPEAKAALYMHAIGVGLELGTKVGAGMMMAVPPSVPRGPSMNSTGPGPVRNTYGPGTPKPAPRTRQSDITGTK